MTDWRAAGQLADAHRVIGIARGDFDGAVKAYIRSSSFGLFKQENCHRLLDLWGGGRSTDDAVQTGLEVLAVDDGSWLLRGHGVSKSRSKRALRVAAEEGGYEWGWGKAQKFAPGCDGAFYDFCGHWCPEVRRTLEASRHMRAVVVTLMPERVAIGKRLKPDEWRMAYGAFLRLALPDHSQRFFRRYKREDGQWAFVFGLALREYHAAQREARNARVRARNKADKAFLAKQNARRRSPQYRAMAAARHRDRYASDPAFRERILIRAREKGQDPQAKARKTEYNKRYWAMTKGGRLGPASPA